MWKRYGIVAIGTYYALYAGMFVGGYLLFESGYIPPVDTTLALEKAHDGIAWMVTKEGEFPPSGLTNTFRRLHNLFETNPQVKSAAMSLVATELAEPIRYVIVLAVTPTLARALGRAPRKV
eukprot:TRINITY_DN3066_c0_g1_i1.p1 TRINITY_DN3066_c0_g1~~TRINITY_DN3066_c0_g1_i1.p1  ORF type:complete len:121 (+),score=38.19 TRINITY_DN3066_c0_g1_i1:1258-1620(+)